MAAGGLLEGATHGPRAVPASSPAIVQLHSLLIGACSDAAATCRDGASLAVRQWRDAAALAFIQVLGSFWPAFAKQDIGETPSPLVAIPALTFSASVLASRSPGWLPRAAAHGRRHASLLATI